MTSSAWICVVDDDADYRAIFQLFFQQSCPRHFIRLFAGGQSFLDALPQMSQPPSLIILDRHMPDLDGHQTLEILKQHLSYKRIPVIMMSAHASSSEINNCYESGANSFILKRLDPASLQESLSTICQYWLELNQVSMAA